MDNICLAQTLWVMASQDIDDLTRDGHARVGAHAAAAEIDQDGQVLDTLRHECDRRLEMEANVADLCGRRGRVLEPGLHVQQGAGLRVES